MRNYCPSLESYSPFEEAMFGVAQLFLTNGNSVLDDLQALFLLQTMLQLLEELMANDSTVNEIPSCYVPKLIIPKWERLWHCSCKQVGGISTFCLICWFSADPAHNQLRVLNTHWIQNSKLYNNIDTIVQWYLITEEFQVTHTVVHHVYSPSLLWELAHI